MEDQQGLSRRSLICGVALLTLGLVPDTAIAANGVKVLANGKVEILLSRNPALKKVGGVVQFEDRDGNSLALVRTSNSLRGYKALNLTCTHEGTTVGLSGNKWICPNHRAEFALDGAVKIGPARSNLRVMPVKATKTKVTVG